MAALPGEKVAPMLHPCGSVLVLVRTLPVLLNMNGQHMAWSVLLSQCDLLHGQEVNICTVIYEEPCITLGQPVWRAGPR